jgi:hypothetical protein
MRQDLEPPLITTCLASLAPCSERVDHRLRAHA